CEPYSFGWGLGAGAARPQTPTWGGMEGLRPLHTSPNRKSDVVSCAAMIELLNQTTPIFDDWRGQPADIRHLYLHIPFCHRRCAYCDFNTYANMDDRMAAYVDALCAELAGLRQVDKQTGSRA